MLDEFRVPVVVKLIPSGTLKCLESVNKIRKTINKRLVAKMIKYRVYLVSKHFIATNRHLPADTLHQ